MSTTLAFVLWGGMLLPADTPAESPPESPAAGLVSYWSFDDNTADSAWLYTNNSGTAEDNLKVVSGPARYVPGKVSRAIRLDGTHLAARFSADVKLPATYTIEAWIKPADLSALWQRFVLHWGSEKGYHFAVHNRQISLYHRQSDNLEPHPEGGTVVEDRWQHVAAVADAQTKRLTVYLDGKPAAAVDYDGTIGQTTREGLGVGDSAGGPGESSKFSGCIDELAVWNVALTDAQIESHYRHPQRRLGLVGKTFRQVVRDHKPEAYWPLDESGGTAVKDVSGNGHDGTCLGGVEFGRPGIPAPPGNKAIILDGKSGHVNLGDVDRLDGLTAITVEAWIRWTGPPGGFTQAADFVRKEGVFAFGGGWFANRGAATHHKARFWIQDSKGVWLNSDNGTTDLDDGRWHHVAGVYDGQFVRIYVDGIEESSRKIGSVTLHANDQEVIIGASGGHGEFFTGAIDEAAVYSRALSPTEVYEHYVFGSDP